MANTNIFALGVVLCGGRSTRMDGVDKGLINYKEKPMAFYSIKALDTCTEIVINANRNQQAYQTQFQLPVISDEMLGYQGPLAGMATAMAYAKNKSLDWVLTCPCDAPFVSNIYVDKMWQAHIENPDTLIFFAFDQFNQPVFSLLNVCLLDEIRLFLKGDHKKILKFYQQIGYEKVLFEDSKLFVNINSIEDLEKAELG